MAKHSELLIIESAGDGSGRSAVRRAFAADRDFYIILDQRAREAAEHITLHAFINGQQRYVRLSELMDDWSVPMKVAVDPTALKR